MADIGYSKKVLDHFMNPRNVGTIEGADGYGRVGNPVCGDLMEMYIKVKDEVITDIKFKTFGCGAAIARGRDATSGGAGSASTLPPHRGARVCLVARPARRL